MNPVSPPPVLAKLGYMTPDRRLELGFAGNHAAYAAYCFGQCCGTYVDEVGRDLGVGVVVVPVLEATSAGRANGEERVCLVAE